MHVQHLTGLNPPIPGHPSGAVIDDDAFLLMDQAVPQMRLGPGVTEYEVNTTATRFFVITCS